jgi:glycogen phosphorylase
MAKSYAGRGRSSSSDSKPASVAPRGGRPPVILPFVRTTHIAYFSMEIAIRSEIHTYSGGLGLLAGDTARECADLELPMVFVTLVSRSGYVRQKFDGTGRQLALPDPWAPERWCARLPTTVEVQIQGRSVRVGSWLALVTGRKGFRIPVLMLDTDREDNAGPDRTLTRSLYGGDTAYRLKQEMVLGLGGLRMLGALGFDLHTYHMNEGHAALLTLDLLAGEGIANHGHGDRPSAREIAGVRRQCVFTTHTPVKAGHDRFDYQLVRRLLPRETDLSGLKRMGGQQQLNMTTLGMNLANYVNGVSQRHAETARRMFPRQRIRAVTNGIHFGTWVHPEFGRWFDRSLPGWQDRPEVLVRVVDLAGTEVSVCHRLAKRSLLDRIRRAGGTQLEPTWPTLVFARRMTGYKRPSLLFEDVDRLATIASRYPFQLVLAGKAHPRDIAGRKAILRIHRALRELGGKVPGVFLPNYDMDWARSLVPGGDVWLQTPLPPMEACGTSGMKAALNGGLNLSPLDGWWAEACEEGVNGWSIATGERKEADRRVAARLYDQLEHVVLPCYYADPDRWASMMRHAIATVGAYFSSQRMLRQYATEAYNH